LVFPAMRGGEMEPLPAARKFTSCAPRVWGWKGDYLRREAGDGVIPVMRGGGRIHGGEWRTTVRCSPQSAGVEGTASSPMPWSAGVPRDARGWKDRPL